MFVSDVTIKFCRLLAKVIRQQFRRFVYAYGAFLRTSSVLLGSDLLCTQTIRLYLYFLISVVCRRVPRSNRRAQHNTRVE